MLALGTLDGEARLLHAMTGEEMFAAPVATGAVTACIAISRDGRAMVAASDVSWRLWNLGDKGQHFGVGHDGEGSCICSRRDRCYMEVDERCPVVGHKARICGIAFSHCGARVVTCANDEFTMVWCAKSGEVLAKHRLHGQGLWDSAVHFSVDGSQLAIRSTKKISIICATSGASLCRLWRPHEGKVSCATFSQDGLMLASGGGSHDPCVRMWDLQSGKALHDQTMGRHQGGVTALGFSCCGRMLASGGADTVCVWDVFSGARLLHLRPPPPLPAKDPDTHLAQCQGVTSCVAFASDGQYLASGGDSGACQIWEVPSGAHLRSIELGAPLVCVATGLDWRERCLAVAMGLHDRLGEKSILRALEPGLFHMIFDL